MNRSILRITGFLLVISSWRAGYSMVNPPLPMELSTWVMAWHDVQASPAWASGVSICSLMGRSKRPLKKTAWSWQPAHHLDGCVPTTSCMYSIDFRYHWLLKDEKWCAEEFHWS